MLSSQQREQIERRLQAEREDAIEALRNFDEQHSISLQEQSGEFSVYRFHLADIGTEAMEREKSFLLASKEGERLYRIDEALRRLYRDPEGFGRCTRCGEQISMERLEVVPATEVCAECAREVEEGAEG
jgi:DnaK suppressor protein